MKKTLFRALLIPVFLLAGCTDVLETPAEESTPEEQLPRKYVITATMPDEGTRVSYHEGENHVLHQKWQVGDHFFGFCGEDQETWFELRISSVQDGVATLATLDDRFPSSGTIHVFYVGRGYEESYNEQYYLNNLPCDVYSLQFLNAIRYFQADSSWSSFTYDPESPDDMNVPGIMTADENVSSFMEEGVLTVTTNLQFKNQTAIIGIGGFTDLLPGQSIDRIELVGVRTMASWELVDGKIAVNYDNMEEIEDIWGEDNMEYAVNLYMDADEDGNLLFNDVPLYIAVLPGTEELFLRARLPYDESMGEPLYYTYDLGSKTIEAGKYYYISPKKMNAPEIPVVTVWYEGEDDGLSFTSLQDGFTDIITNATESPYVSIQLRGDCTADAPLFLGGNVVEQEVTFILDDHTLTLNENHFMVDAGEDLTLSLLGGSVKQDSDSPILTVSGGKVIFDADSYTLLHSESSSAALITATGTGTVDVVKGYFEWGDSPFASGDVALKGGFYSKNPGTCAPGFTAEQIDNPDFPYFCLPASAYGNLAQTSDGVLKTFSIYVYGSYTPFLLPRNNVYRDGDDVWHFEGPNWTAEGQVPNSASHQNLFSYNEIKDALTVEEDDGWGPYSYIGPLSVSGVPYEWMNSSQWSALLNVNADQQKNCYIKCTVQDETAAWRNLLLFPDTYVWPSTAGSAPEAGIINKHNLTWADAPTFTVSQAEALLGAGFVFLPASYPVTRIDYDENEEEIYVFDHYDGYYWSSSSGASFIFTDNTVQYQTQGNVYNEGYSLRVVYPLE